MPDSNFCGMAGLPDFATPETSKREHKTERGAGSELACSEWFDALWERWVRTRDIHQVSWRDHASKYSEGYADAIYDLLKDAKRTLESASNAKLTDTGGEERKESRDKI
jgi:hypothetical protein